MTREIFEQIKQDHINNPKKDIKLYLYGRYPMRVDRINDDNTIMCYDYSNEMYFPYEYADLELDKSDFQKKIEAIIEREHKKIKWKEMYSNNEYFFDKGLELGLRLGYKLKLNDNKVELFFLFNFFAFII